MNILYFLEPSIEQKDSLFRFSSFKSLIVPEIAKIKESSTETVITILTSTAVIDKYKRELGALPADNVVAINHEDLQNVLGTSEEIPVKMKQGNFSQDKIKSYSKYLQEKFDTQFDVIIAYETFNPALEHAFPSALILNVMFGSFSRAPFPSMVSIDPYGIYDESFLYVNKEKILTEVKEKNLDNDISIKHLRRMANKALSKNIQIKELIYDIKKSYESTILLPLQVDDHLSFTCCSEFSSHFELVKFTLDNIEENIGLIVTGHNYKAALSSDDIAYFEQNYSNFYYFKNSENVPSVSQFILPYMNGAVTVSSSVGYQAALWQKPLYIAGKSQLSILESTPDFSDFIGQVQGKEQIDRDGILSYIYNYYNFSYKFDIFKEGAALKIYQKALDLHHKGCIELLYSKNYEGMEKVKRSQQMEREWLLRKEVTQTGLPVYPDYLRLGYSLNKAVSYDLFDTLAERDFVNPHELFSLVELQAREDLKNKNLNFVYFRREAEKDVRRPTKGEYEITIDQIYNQFQSLTGYSDEMCNYIKKLEIEIELALIHPKRFMLENYHFSRILVDKVSIISDIYLEENVIDRVVKKIGAIPYDLLYSSASTKTRKHNGTIYPQYLDFLSKYKIDKRKALHVGDNATADGEMAKKHGLNTYVKPKAIDNFKNSKIAQVMQGGISTSALSTSVLNGVIANQFYGTSYNKQNKDSLFQGDGYQFGYTALGPLVYGFTQKLIRRVKQGGYTDIYFLARDGWILKSAFDKIVTKIPGCNVNTKYLYASRRAAMVASIKSWDDIFEVASQSFNAQPIEDFLNARFGLEWSADIESTAKLQGYKKGDIVSPYAEQPKLLALLRSLESVILKVSASEREAYYDYLEEEGLCGANALNSKPLLVDIGYSGSMQHYLKKVLHLEVLDGYYLLTHHHSRGLFEYDLFEGYLSDTDDHKTPYRHKLNDYVFLFESCLSSPEGSLLNFTGTGSSRRMNLLDADEEQSRIKLLHSMHRGANFFIESIVNRFDKYIRFIEFSPSIAERIIVNSFQYPNGLDAQIFKGIEVENVFGGGSVYLMPPIDPDFNKTDEISHFIAMSKWQGGARAYINLVRSDRSPNNDTKIDSLKPKINKKDYKVYRDKRKAKLSKLKRNPYMYFADIQDRPRLRVIKHLFNSDYPHGRFFSYLVYKTVK